jgi:hypothetical protein
LRKADKTAVSKGLLPSRFKGKKSKKAPKTKNYPLKKATASALEVLLASNLSSIVV